MASYNMADLVKAGLEAEDSGGNYSNWEPPAGERLICTVVKSNGSDDGGAPKWGAWLEVTAGEHKGKRFWVNMRFSQEWEFITRQAIDMFAGFGIGPEFLSSNSVDVITSALEGKSAVIITAYRKDKKKKNKDGTPVLWPDHRAEPVRTTPAPPPAAAADDEEWDD